MLEPCLDLRDRVEFHLLLKERRAPVLSVTPGRLYRLLGNLIGCGLAQLWLKKLPGL